VILSRLALKRTGCWGQFLFYAFTTFGGGCLRTKDRRKKPPSIPRGKINSPLSPPSKYIPRCGGTRGRVLENIIFCFNFVAPSFRHASSLSLSAVEILSFYISCVDECGAAALWLFDVSSSSCAAPLFVLLLYLSRETPIESRSP
jgi:hypothetical protein